MDSNTIQNLISFPI